MAKKVRRRGNFYSILGFGVVSVLLWHHRDKIAHPDLLAEAIGGLILVAAFIYFWIRHKTDRTYYATLKRVGISDPMSLTGVEYEDFCALLLRECGWKTAPTRTTGDFGADIIAKRRGKIMVVQCKRYKSPVGVKAIQEVHGAAAYYNAEKTAVITCTGYTRAALALAKRTKTALIVLGRDYKADLGSI